ncbi:MAG: hypothetical protein COB04_16350 [Gammaproteobacteria bacterium]|nr:MAG: hypothetical protein COB04_16350 [Gammaproteobacteria bacterium]
MKLVEIQVGDELPSREHVATNVSLFLYNAAIWNAHRIHYDEPYAMNVEGHPGVVIDGPLQGDWLSQCAINWVREDGQLVSFEYSNRASSCLGETLTSGGKVIEVDEANRRVSVELFIKNEKGEITTPGSATIQFN